MLLGFLSGNVIRSNPTDIKKSNYVMGSRGPGGVILKAYIPRVSGNLANGKPPTQRI